MSMIALCTTGKTQEGKSKEPIVTSESVHVKPLSVQIDCLVEKTDFAWFVRLYEVYV